MVNITINHVAEKAGVSIKTVSRVLNGEPNVAESTREKVKAVVAALNFRPNIAARSLAGSRSYLLGLLFDNPSPDYVVNLQFGAIRECRGAGYHLVVDWLDSSEKGLDAKIGAFLGNIRADGFILSPPICDNEAVLNAIEAMGAPYVRIAPYRDVDRAPSVNIDDAGAAFEMATLLIDLGHRDIGFIKGHADHGATHLRYGGYSAALRAKGVPLLQKRVRQGDFSARSGIECAEDLLTGEDRPTAIFASNDEMALGVMLVANRLGLRVPQDLSICGFDDMAAAKLVWPQLTTVRQPIADMSAAAAELLINRSTTGVGGRLLDFEIVVRGSTGPAPV
jgi:LacI family transcriptional regulator